MSELAEAQRQYKSARFEEAARIGGEILSREPDNADALNVVAMSFLMTGRWGDALPMLERVVQLKPNYANALANLAFLNLRRREFVQAEAQARRATELSPNMAIAHVTLGRALAEQGRKDDGAASLRRALELDPRNVDALYWLGYIAGDARYYDESCEFFSRALQIQADHLPSIYMLALGQHKQGLLDDAIATYAKGVQVAPHDAMLHSNLLFAKTYHSTISPRELLDESKKWAALHANPPANEVGGFEVSRDADRKLRIGYVSPYFQEHSVAFFMEPIVEQHDRAKFAVVLYSDVKDGDATTARFKQLATDWRDTRGLNDTALADLVRRDKIDILVDLTQHSGGSRLRMFARKPAAILVAYLGYPNTTGLPAIQYRLSDRFLDPIGRDEALSSEETVRLPQSYFCYRPPSDAPDVAPEPPSARNGFITFASQNALVKLNDRCIATWARVLNSVENSRLVIKAAGCESEFARARYTSKLQSHGVDPSRIIFRGHSPLRELMTELNDVDIALDTFPYNGGTTTCHILWMGVPVVSLAGEMPVHRMGLSVLSQVGLADLVAESDDQFVEIATMLARDQKRLRDLRRDLRDRMKRSPLMNAARFTKDLEEIYRQMWRQYLAT